MAKRSLLVGPRWQMASAGNGKDNIIYVPMVKPAKQGLPSYQPVHKCIMITALGKQTLPNSAGHPHVNKQKYAETLKANKSNATRKGLSKK